MTIGTYTTVIPLPPPVTTGTTVQSYIDPNGDTWVAKNGIQGGNWQRARNVCAGRLNPTSNQAITVAGFTQVTFQTATYDPLNQKSGNNWVVPIAGRYSVVGSINLQPSPTAVGSLQAGLRWNNAARSYGNVTYFAANGPMWPAVHFLDILVFAVGDLIGLDVWSSTTSGVNVCGTATRTWLAISYEGSN
jgi:hypothetical protein